MKEKPRDFWFPVKTYGWGWGLPVRWQGWMVLIAYAFLLYSGIRYFRGRHDTDGLLMYSMVLTVLLVAVVVMKGEKPAAWRWGKK